MNKELLMTNGLAFNGEFNGENNSEFSGQEWEDESSPRRQRPRRSTRSHPAARGRWRRRPRPVRVRGASEYVRWLQSALNQIMGLRLPLDGLMGIATRSALRSFQKQQGLPMDGLVGPSTERALLAARGGQPPAKRASQPSEPEPPVESPSQPSEPEPPDESSSPSSEPEPPETEYTQFSVEPFAFVGEFAAQENPESLGQEWEEESSRQRSRPRRSTRPQTGGRVRRRTRPRALPVLGASEYVRWVQSALNQSMDLRLPLDGVLGTATRSALRRFQQREGLPVDGIVGPDTEQALLAARGGQVSTKRRTQASEPEPSETEVAEQAWEGWVGEVASNYSGAPSYIPTNTPDSLTPVLGIENTSQAFRLKVIRIAQGLDTDPNFLMAIMSFESNGFNPQARNPHSGATGLIQFMPKTATNLGTTTDALARMTAEQQLDYVAKYFAPYKGRLKTLDDAYMAVLWPPAIGQGSNYVLFSSPSTAYQQNQSLDVNKDGKVTVAEATSFVRKKLGSTATAPIGSPTSSGGPMNRSSPEYIRWVQQALNKLMGVQLAVDGISGPMTRSAVRSFQQKHGLLVDGIVGPQTEGALIKAGAQPLPTTNYPSHTPPLTYPYQPQPAPNQLETSLQALQQKLDSDLAQGRVSRTQADRILQQARTRIYLPFDMQRITSPWGWRTHPIDKTRKLHQGADFGIPTGTPVPAVKAGTVARSYTSDSFGETVILYHGQDVSDNQYYTLYAHNSQRLVREGQRVSQNQIISHSGSTGQSTGPHLHYEVRIIPAGIEPTSAAFFNSQYSVNPQDHLWPDLI